MTPETQTSLTADATLDVVYSAATTKSAYRALVSEVASAREKLSPIEYKRYWQHVKQESAPLIPELALAYAEDKFSQLDQSGNDRLEYKELLPRSGKERFPSIDLEHELTGSLRQRFAIVRSEARTGSWWNFYTRDPDAITREDLAAGLRRADALRAKFRVPATDAPELIDVPRMPKSVSNLLDQRQIKIKMLPGSILDARPDLVDQFPTIAFASALYVPETKEILVTSSRHKEESVQHEIGHAIDDALAVGSGYFSDRTEVIAAVERDLKTLPALNWQKELPTAHPYIVRRLETGKMDAAGRRELFADLYQNVDVGLAQKLRALFPATAQIIDSRLALEQIDRFAPAGHLPSSVIDQ